MDSLSEFLVKTLSVGAMLLSVYAFAVMSISAALFAAVILVVASAIYLLATLPPSEDCPND